MTTQEWTRKIFMQTTLTEDQAREAAQVIVRFEDFPTLDDSLVERMPDYERKVCSCQGVDTTDILKNKAGLYYHTICNKLISHN